MLHGLGNPLPVHSRTSWAWRLPPLAPIVPPMFRGKPKPEKQGPLNLAANKLRSGAPGRQQGREGGHGRLHNLDIAPVAPTSIFGPCIGQGPRRAQAAGAQRMNTGQGASVATATWRPAWGAMVSAGNSPKRRLRTP